MKNYTNNPFLGIVPFNENFSFMKSNAIFQSILNCKSKILQGIMMMILVFLVSINSVKAQCTLACNDEIQVSLNSDCEFLVTVEHLLEGKESCVGEVLTVVIKDFNDKIISNPVGSEYIGKVLKASVVSDLGNSCWSSMLVEDKLAAPLICDTVYTTCSGNLLPGSPVPMNVSYAADVTLPAISAGFDETFDIYVFGIDGATINDVDFLVDIEHSDLSDLQITVTNPLGTPRVLVPDGSLSATCDNGMMVTFDDEAAMTFPDLTDVCVDGDEKIGRFEANESLDVYDGLEPKGIWKVRIQNSGASTGAIKKLVLVLKQSGATVKFPGDEFVTGMQTQDNTFILYGLDACSSVEATFTDVVKEQPCDNPIDKIIERTWNAIDSVGNISEPCTQFIYVYRNDLSTLVLPLNFDGGLGQNDVLSCSDFGTEVPDSSVTGYPTGDFCDKVAIFPIKDKRIDICPGSYKLLREFHILEWCTDELIVYTQLIKVVDTLGPDIENIDDITISALPYDCFGEYDAPLPDATDDCSDEFTYELSYQFADIYGNFSDARPFQRVPDNGTIIKNLPIGTTLIKWTVTDECKQSSEETFRLTVRDEVPPVAVCDEFTVTSIGSDGYALVTALAFDDLSHDNCEIVSYQAKKMTNSCQFDGSLQKYNNNNVFRDTIAFCCAEVGTSIMVAMQVTDSSNNTNTCMVEIRIEDKLPPYIKNCPKDITLDCFADYTDLEITGNIIAGIDAIDNCDVTVLPPEDQGAPDNCGEGVITRFWTVIDQQGFKGSCVQLITLRDMDPFNENDIIEPDDFITNDCDISFHPDSLEDRYRLRVNEDHCNQVAVTYEDQIFYMVQAACEKVLRHWTVIDWCTYEREIRDGSVIIPEKGVYTHLQVLKRINNIKPDITNCGPLTIMGFNENCSGDIDFTIEATDDCTPEDELTFSYQLDLNNDDSFTAVVSSASIVSVLPVGIHKIRWFVSDRCGNTATCDQIITVVDKKKPTPYCITSLTTVVMHNNMMVEIWARDYDFGANDNCTAQEDLLFTFDEAYPVESLIASVHYFKGLGILATLDEYLQGDAQKWIPRDNTAGRVLDCSYIPDGKESSVPVTISVWDEAKNTDFCYVELVLQDNSGDACEAFEEEESIFIAGRVFTPTQINLDDSDVKLISNLQEMNRVSRTNSSGLYNFNSLKINAEYTVRPEKNDDPINGVSTLDIVMIQRHLLGMSLFDSPLKIIASDADNNNKVSAADIIIFRKLILGINDKFPANQKSWRFIKSDYEFTNVENPFPYFDGIELFEVKENKDDQDFLAIKIGDVNDDAKANARHQVVKTRSVNEMVLQMPSKKVKRGDEVSIPIYISNINDLLGMQFTIDYDPSLLKYSGVNKGSIAINADNIGSNYEKDGILTLSWNEVEAVQVSPDNPVFNLRFEVLEDNKTEIGINSAVTKAEAYDRNGGIMDLTVETKEVNSLVLIQNNPNPFTDVTRIDFNLPEASNIVLEINDVSGRLLTKITGYYPEGYNSIQVNGDDLEAKGVLYYTLKAGKRIVTKKMIKL